MTDPSMAAGSAQRDSHCVVLIVDLRCPYLHVCLLTSLRSADFTHLFTECADLSD